MDIILSEYTGWSDEYLLGNPLCRIRQILELITQRKLEENRFLVRVTERETKNISSMFVGLAEDKKQAKAMSKMVDKMRLPLADELNEIEDNRSIEEIMEQGAKVDVEAQPRFEALSSALGRM